MTSDRDEAALADADRIYRRCVDECYAATPEWHGKILRPKKCCPAGSTRAHSLGIAMSFSRSLIEYAGGVHNLREHWEVES